MENNSIIKRLAIKSTYSGPTASPTEWYSWPLRTIPSEIAAMRTVNKEPTNPFVIKYMGHRMFDNERAFRFAMPFAEFGSMGGALYQWAHLNPDGRLPKAFLLDCFAALATACKLLVDRNMLHNDLKHINFVMVADPDGDMCQFAHEADTKTKGWGVKPVLIDFGLALPIRSDAFKNPMDMIGRGTTGWRPPEQTKNPGKTESLPLPGVEVGEKAMVFGLGATMFSFLHSTSHIGVAGRERQFGHRDYDSPKDYMDLYMDPYDEEFNDREHVGEHFTLRKTICTSRTVELRKIIIHCLRLQPGDRPSFDELLELIKEERGKHRQYQRHIFDNLETTQSKLFRVNATWRTWKQDKLPKDYIGPRGGPVWEEDKEDEEDEGDAEEEMEE